MIQDEMRKSREWQGSLVAFRDLPRWISETANYSCLNSGLSVHANDLRYLPLIHGSWTAGEHLSQDTEVPGVVTLGQEAFAHLECVSSLALQHGRHLQHSAEWHPPDLWLLGSRQTGMCSQSLLFCSFRQLTAQLLHHKWGGWRHRSYPRIWASVRYPNILFHS